MVHALLNTGLVAVAIAGLARAKLGRVAELAWVEGAGTARFLARVALPVLAPDLARLFLFVFALCFASFSVPLVIGGVHASTVEVLIYQRLRLDSDWTQAGSLALMQSLCVLGFTWVMARGRDGAGAVTGTEVNVLPLFGWLPGLAFVVAPVLLLIVGLLDTNLQSIRQVLAFERFTDELPGLILGSFAAAVLAGLVICVLLMALAYVRPSGAFQRALMGYVAPSAALTGYALLFVWRDFGASTYAKIALGVVLISLPAFLRWQWDALLSGLQGQIDTARALGAGPGLIFRRVVGPQLVKAGAFAGGVTALWTWGDFALSSVVAERSVTVALAARGLMDSYRLDAATFLAWIMLAGGLVTCAIFMGVGNVLGARSQT
jgi:thiamine transport system permease protein